MPAAQIDDHGVEAYEDLMPMTKEAPYGGIVQDHLKRFNYSSLDLFLEGLKPFEERKIPSLEVDSPCYCYQHGTKLNALLKGVLIPAIVVMTMEEEANDASIAQIRVTHCLSLVEDQFLFDAGFAANSLRGGLFFERSQEQTRSLQGDQYRILRVDSNCFKPQHFATDSEWYRLLVRVDRGWLEIFRFAPDAPLSQKQMVQMNYDLVKNPIRQWIRDDVLLLSKVTPTERWQLLACKDRSEPPTIEILGNKESVVKCESFWQMKQLTLDIFGVDLPDEVEKAFFA